MTSRYFRSNEETYSAVLASLNDTWGLPDKGQRTAFALPDDAPKDNQGRLYLAVLDYFCHYPDVFAVLPGLLESGAVEEITAEQYAAVQPPYQP
jgi:hypothetical protein